MQDSTKMRVFDPSTLMEYLTADFTTLKIDDVQFGSEDDDHDSDGTCTLTLLCENDSNNSCKVIINVTLFEYMANFNFREISSYEPFNTFIRDLTPKDKYVSNRFQRILDVAYGKKFDSDLVEWNVNAA